MYLWATSSLLLFCLSPFSRKVGVSAFSAVAPAAVQPQQEQQYDENVYWDQYTAGQRLDQDAYTSPLFWEDVERHLPSFSAKDKEAKKRFMGFCENLKNGKPGVEIELPTGQQVLEQYFYPGIDDGDSTSTCKSVIRSGYPADHYKELIQLYTKLASKVRPVAQAELAALLEDKPLVGDDDALSTTEDEQKNIVQEVQGESWQRAAWYGWQYLNLRGAKKNMPLTAKALSQAMGNLGPAHRFVGLSRQKADCEGVVHSDGRNYMLSTLTPIEAPIGHCGIFVDGENAKIETDPVILDNTFPHYIYNTHPTEDRFCIMSECYHPALTKKERDAIATLFAVKDRFTVNELQLAPWGYDDDDLEQALKTGAVHDLNYWKDIVHVPKKNKNTKKGGGGGFGGKK